MAAMDAPATSALSQTSARSRISTTAAITPSGISPAASHPVETDATTSSQAAVVASQDVKKSITTQKTYPPS